jgi:dienelactone hydrolase
MVLVAMVATGAGGWILTGTGRDLRHRHVVVGGVPIEEVHPAGARAGEGHPGVAVAHGYAGSAKLMSPFADSLSTQGYVVVLLDFSGHGTNARPLPDGGANTDASTAALQHDLDVAVTHLRGLPDVDPARVMVVGHSVGAATATRYALTHPEVKATVAISLPDSSYLPPDRPARLLLLVGGAEFAGFRIAADRAAGNGAAGNGRPDRAAVVVPGVEHIGILYAPRTHREVVTWLDDSVGEPAHRRPIPAPVRRLCAAGLLMLAFLLALYPVAWLLLGGPPRWPPVARRIVAWPACGRIVVVAAGAALVATLVAPIAPTTRLPVALGGYLVGFTTTVGLAILAYHRWRGGISASAPDPAPSSAAAPPARPGRLRVAMAAPVLIAYAAATIAVPVHLGLTNAVPVSGRWWPLAVVWAGFAVLAYAGECVAGGNSVGVLTVSAVVVIAMTCVAVAGFAPGFLLLVVPLFRSCCCGRRSSARSCAVSRRRHG